MNNPKKHICPLKYAADTFYWGYIQLNLEMYGIPEVKLKISPHNNYFPEVEKENLYNS